MSTSRIVRVALIATMVAWSAACGGDDADTSATTAAPAGAPAGDAQVIIADFSFGDPVTVSAGSGVTVRNDDTVPHTWTAADGTFDSGSLGTGESFTHTFETAGTFDFLCTIHPSMTGSITVTG